MKDADSPTMFQFITPDTPEFFGSRCLLAAEQRPALGIVCHVVFHLATLRRDGTRATAALVFLSNDNIVWTFARRAPITPPPNWRGLAPFALCTSRHFGFRGLGFWCRAGARSVPVFRAGTGHYSGGEEAAHEDSN